MGTERTQQTPKAKSSRVERTRASQNNETQQIPELTDAIDPSNMTPATVMQLQRTYGNAYVQRVLNGTNSATGFQSSLVQRAFNKKENAAFNKLAEDANAFNRIKTGEGIAAKDKLYNYNLIKKILNHIGARNGASFVNDAAAFIGGKLNATVEVEEESKALADPLERFNEFVDVKSGVEIDRLNDAETWKRFILNGIALDSYSSAQVSMITGSGKNKKTIESGLEHRTQKAANRSVWYKRESGKVVVYALAQHGSSNTQYSAISAVSDFPSNWTLKGKEATAG